MEKPSYEGENPFTNAIKQVIKIEIDDMKNEIKKALYKQRPIAELTHIRGGKAFYQTTINENDVVRFEVPIDDMGDADFFPEMDGKLMIRWLVVDVSDL